MSTEPAAVSPVGSATSPKIWRVGTLVYTTSGLVVLFCWLLWGDFAYQLRDRALTPMIPLLLKDHHASDTMLGGLTTSAPALLVIILTPIFSYLSDRHRGPRGRRIPYLFAIIPISVLAIVGLAYAPLVGKTDRSVLTCAAIFSILFTACDTICNLIFLGLCNDVVPREVIGRFFGLFRVVSLGAGIIFSFFLLKRVEGHFTAIFLSMAAVYGVGFTMMCIKVREGEYPPPEAEGQTPWRATATYLRDCFSHSYYRWLFLSIALANMAFTPFNTFMLFFATRTLHMGLGFYGKAMATQFFVSFLQSYFLGWLADKIHPLRLTIISLVLYTTASLCCFYFVHTARGGFLTSVFVGSAAGWWLTANGPLCMALFPKIEFAQFYAAAGIISSSGMLLVAFLCGRFLDHMDHNYRYILLWNAVLAVLSLLATCVVYRKFLVLGGPKSYVAPLAT